MTRAARRHWLLKTEPGEFSIDDLERDGRTLWTGIRNYRARNILRDEVKAGDLVLIHHSSAARVGAAGVGRVAGAPRPDPTAGDPASPYHDPRPSPAGPRWWAVEVEFLEKFPEVVTLGRMRAEPSLAGLPVLARGNRLSVQPVDEEHFRRILRLGRSSVAGAAAPR